MLTSPAGQELSPAELTASLTPRPPPCILLLSPYTIATGSDLGVGGDYSVYHMEQLFVH